MDDIKAVLESSDFFTVTTEKIVETVEGAPWKRLMKVSTFHIVTGPSLSHFIRETPKLTWGKLLDDGKTVVHEKQGKGIRLYILATLDRQCGFGKSEYHPVGDHSGEVNMERSYQKRDIKKYLPEEKFDGETFCLPIDNITEIVPKKVQVAAIREKGDELPF